MKKILVIDSKGGGIGKQIIMNIKKEKLDMEVVAVGTNSVATETMLRAGADLAVTGENACLVNARTADYIIGPVGIVIADSIHGEITPKMALAVAQSLAKRILLPLNQCDNYVVGIEKNSMNDLVDQAIQCLKSFLN